MADPSVTAGAGAAASAGRGVPRVIGLTGGIASGKSTVARLLRAHGAVVVDADEVARAVVEPGRPAYERIVAAFGRGVLKAPPADAPGSGTGPIPVAQAPPPLDREKLAALVFADAAARSTLNRITHPEIAAESGRRLVAAASSGAPLLVYEVPLLVENNLQHGLDGLVVVDVPEEVQLARAVARGGLTREQAQARMAAQSPRQARLRFANWIIDNSQDEAAAAAQVAAAWPVLRDGPTPPPRPLP